MQFNKNPIVIRKIINEMQGIFSKACDEKNIEFRLSTDIDEDSKLTLTGDAVRLKQVITNLLSNAIKFTEKGYVKLEIFHHISGTVCFVTLKVSDTGIGMTNIECDKIFNEFSQANDSINAKYGGTGLGLAISKRIVEQTGGEITVDSHKGDGTTFEVRFKLPVHEEILANTDELIESINTNELSILVAEDNPVNQILIKEILKSENIKYSFAENGKEAIDKLLDNKNHFNLCLFDIRMPVMDGYEAVSKMKTFEQFKGIPVIALSADANESSIMKAKNAGFDDFLPKPFQIIELKKVIAKYKNLIQ